MYKRSGSRNLPNTPLFKRNSEIQGALGKGLHQDRRHTNWAIGTPTKDYEMPITDTHLLFMLVLAAAFIDWILS